MNWTIEYSPNFHAILCMHTEFALWYWGCATLGLDGVA